MSQDDTRPSEGTLYYGAIYGGDDPSRWLEVSVSMTDDGTITGVTVRTVGPWFEEEVSDE